MIPSVEKVLFLKNIDLFEKIPAEDLYPIAAIAEEVNFATGAEFIKDGDEGDCLYLIVDGLVKVHRGQTVFVELGEETCVGEMAILDAEPRSASVTALTDLVLLRISRDDFSELLIEKPEIARGILQVLTHRLREANKRAS